MSSQLRALFQQHWRRIVMREWLVPLLVFCYTFVLFVVVYFPKWFFPFDLDPTDGDMVNLGSRILLGLPIYGDGKSGALITAYPPVYPLLIAAGKALFGMDVVRWARIFNMACVSAGFGVVYLWVRRFNGRKNGIELLLPFCFLLPLWIERFSESIWLRPDALLFFVELIAFYLFFFHRRSVWLIASLSAVAVFTRQTGIILPAVIGTCALLWDRRFLPRYIGIFIATFCFITGGMFALKMGVRDYFVTLWLDGSRMYAGCLSNDHLRNLVQGAFFAKGPLKIGALVPVVAAVGGLSRVAIRRDFSFGLLFVLAFMLLVYTGRNVGGGPNYTWLVVALYFVLFVDGARFLLRLLAVKGAMHRTIVVALCCIVTVPFVARHYSSWSFNGVDGDVSIVEEYVREIAPWVRESQERRQKWYSDRRSMPLVMHGVVLERESCLALMAADTYYPLDLLRRQFACGRYGYIQENGYGIKERIGERLFRDCFELVFESRVVSSRIYRYSGSKPACVAWQIANKGCFIESDS